MKRYAILILSILSLLACSNQDSREWFDTKEEAIQYGVSTEENGVTPKILSTEEYQGETIVFYDLAGNLGVASISENIKGNIWYRSNSLCRIRRGN